MIFLQSLQKNNSQKGFTLVEMIISIALFTVVAVVAIGALLKVVSSNKKAQSLKTSINNLNFALESISREMRIGRNYQCAAVSTIPTNSPNGCSTTRSGIGASWTVAFDSPVPYPSADNPQCKLKIAYQFDLGTIKRAEQTNCSSWTAFSPLISSDITFTAAAVRSWVLASTKPYIQFRFAGYSGLKEKDKTYFDIQTTISQRLLN